MAKKPVPTSQLPEQPPAPLDEEGLALFEAICATPGVCGFDYETTIARAADREICTVQAAHEDGREVMVQVYRNDTAIFRVAQALTFAECELAAHNACFEWEVCWKIGARPPRLHCTYIAARVLHGAMIGTDNEEDEEFGGWALADLVWEFFQVVLDKTLQTRDWRLPLDAPSIHYGLEDARYARDLWIRWRAEFDGFEGPDGVWVPGDPDQRRGYDLLDAALPWIARANVHGGMTFDVDYHNQLCIRLEEDREAHAWALDLWSRWEIGNHNSAVQVSRWVAQELFNCSPLRAALLFKQATGEEWPLTANGHLSLDRRYITRLLETIEIAWPGVADYLRNRVFFQKEGKMLQAFGRDLQLKIDADGCIRCSLVPHGARTSRMSARDPNLQQQPNDYEDSHRNLVEFRRCYLARKGRKIVICDYGQIELRVGSIIADDKRMQAIFKDGVDIHAATAVAVFALGAYDENNPAHKRARKKAKAPNFAALYGAEAFTIALNANIPMAEAIELLSKWLDAYPGVARYRQEMPELGRKQGYIQIVSGQKIAVVDSTRPAQMINAPVQGSSASVLYRAVDRVCRRLEEEGLDAVLFLLVHDEFLLDASEADAPAAAKVLQEEMTAALLEFFPIAAELGIDNLADAAICNGWWEKDSDHAKLKNYLAALAA